MNVLGLVVFSIVFGIVLGRMGDKGTPLKAFFETLNEVVMKMVTLVMWYVMHIVIIAIIIITTCEVNLIKNVLTFFLKINKDCMRIFNVHWQGIPESRCSY